MKNYIEELKNVFPLTGIISISVIIAFILCLIDYLIQSNKSILSFPQILQIFLVGVIVILILCFLIHLHFVDLFKMPCANALDSFLWGLLLVSLIYLPITCVVSKSYTVKHILITGFIILWLLLIIYRLSFTYRESISHESRSNIYDLKEIYEGDFNADNDMPVLIDEKDVDYDLLNRSALIDQLIKTIYSCSTESSYVIGLEGEWGSGKTTIINNVKRIISGKDDIIVVKDFDPWLFGTQEAMLRGMYDLILESTGIKYSSLQSRNMLKSISATVSSGFFLGNTLQQTLYDRTDSYSEVKNIKSKLSMLLRKTNKTFVFFIDNIDRADADNVIFLFKLIGTMFDLPGIVYVLLYDRERINSIFSDTKKINPKYLEKIIQIELKVPSIQKESLKNVYDRCISNILKAYGVSSEGMHEYEKIFYLICEKVLDLRKFKRLINSAFPITFLENKILNQKDLLSLEVIRFLEPGLYFEIRDNPVFFVSNDPMSDIDIYRAHNGKKEFNNEGEIYFGNLFNKYSEYFDVLADLFPFVARYKNTIPLISDYSTGDTEYKYISKNASICSAKYFDLYFSYGNNDYTSIKSAVKVTINEIKGAQSKDQLNNIMHMVFSAVPEKDHHEWLEQFQYYINDIPKKFSCEIANSLFISIYEINQSYRVLALNARSRAEFIIETLLEASALVDVQKFAKEMAEHYDKLVVISNILYWFGHTQANEGTEDILERENIIKKVYSSMCKNVIESPINLYEDPYYHRENIWGLLKYYKDDEENISLLEEYMKKFTAKDTVFRVLGDAIIISVGNTYGYSITEESLNNIYVSEKAIDFLLSQNTPKTDSEKFVLKVYEKYKADERDVFGRCSVPSLEEVNLQL